jgi:glycosyltransferase involved in cell wall biosynthesis
MTRVLLICNDAVGRNMAGPGIRYWEFARALGRYVDVTLAVPPFVPIDGLPSMEELPARVCVCDHQRDLRLLVQDSDTVVMLGALLLRYPFLGQLDKPVVVDLYDPFLLENLQRQAGGEPEARLDPHEGYLRALRDQMYVGDFFICADEKQRDYWLGGLSVAGRVNPYTHHDDASLRRLIDVVPFGLPAAPPDSTRPVLKGIHPAIAPEDKVILWGGGIWNWLDAETLIRAMPLILDRRADVKLFFMGVSPPDGAGAGAMAAEEAIRLSQELGLHQEYVLFNDWVPYEERQSYLLEADVGASLHLDHIETRFSFRTRLLDYLWAGLPFVATAGDVLSERLADAGLACLVSPRDVDGVADAILSIVSNPSIRTEAARDARRIAARYRWDAVVQPLVRFCMDPHMAPDKVYLGTRPSSMHGRTGPSPLLSKACRTLLQDGFSVLIQRSGQYLRWKLNSLGRSRG